jgi:cytosine/creatinine deaminase
VWRGTHTVWPVAFRTGSTGRARLFLSPVLRQNRSPKFTPQVLRMHTGSHDPKRSFRATRPDLEQCRAMLRVAIDEARIGLEEGGVPVGAALFNSNGNLLGRGRNRRVQEGDPSVHGETDAFRKAGRQRSYRDKTMVTTLAPCWYCSGLVRQFNIGTLIVGESVSFRGGLDWLIENGVRVVDLHSQECIDLLQEFIAEKPHIWNEDIGEE